MAEQARPVESIWFNGANGDLTIKASDSTTLTWIQEYRGDRDDMWVLEEFEGHEVARHNCRFIATIRWAHHKDTPGAQT